MPRLGSDRAGARGAGGGGASASRTALTAACRVGKKQECRSAACNGNGRAGPGLEAGRGAAQVPPSSQQLRSHPAVVDVPPGKLVPEMQFLADGLLAIDRNLHDAQAWIGKRLRVTAPAPRRSGAPRPAKLHGDSRRDSSCCRVATVDTWSALSST